MSKNHKKNSLPVARVWTDGSACPANPGPGGWAALIQKGNGEENLISGSTPWSSNIRMELTAVLRALQYLETPHVVIIYTDSQYIVDGFRNILFRDKLLKSHYDTWGIILHLAQFHRIKISKVKAHAGDSGNEQVDRAAKKAAKEQPGDPYMWRTERIIEEKRLREKGIEKNSWEW